MPSSRAILSPRLAARNGRGSLRPASIAREGYWDGRVGRLSGAAHDETEELSHAELGKIKGDRDALAEREKELRVGPGLDLSRLTRVVAQAVKRQREGLARVKEPEPIRDALRAPGGR